MMDLKKQKKSVNFMLSAAYFVLLFRLVPIHHSVGDLGTGIFAAGYLLFFLYDFFVRELFSGSLAKLINSRVKREQYKDAERAFDFALPVSIIMGILVTAIVYFFAPVLGAKLLGIEQSVKVLRYMAPAFLFVTVSAVFSAYLKGMGEHINDSIVRLGTELLVTLLCILMSGMMYRQGGKVAALLKQQEFAGIYGAQGCGLAVSLATFLCMLIYLFLCLQMKVSMRRRLQKDTESRDEGDAVCVQYLFILSAVHYLNYLLLALFLLAQERILIGNAQALEQSLPFPGRSAVIAWGAYAGAAAPFLFAPLAVSCMGGRGAFISYKRALGRDERKYVRDSIQTKMRRFCMVNAPAGVFVAVFASPLVNVVYGESGACMAGAVSAGALSVFFYGFAFILMQVLLGLEKNLYITAIHAAGLISHIVTLQITIKAGEAVYTGIGTAGLISSVLMAVAYGFIVSMQLNYRHNVLHMIKPALSAAAAGFVGFIVVKLAGKAMGSILTLLVGGVLFVLFYLIMMVVLRGMTKREISRIPGGEFIMRLLYSRGQ